MTKLVSTLAKPSIVDDFVDPAQQAELEKKYNRSIDDPEGFWAEEGRRLDWIKPYTQVKDVSYNADDLHIRWFHDGTLNVSANCIDRHLEKRGDQVAIIWEGDEPSDDQKITYRQLHEHVCKLANVMKAQGVKKGDRVTIYMPMIPEAAYAMLACARIGAIHSIVFGGFSPDALAGRIDDCNSKLRDHRRRRPARRPNDSAEGQHRRSADQVSIASQRRAKTCQGARGAPHRRRDRAGSKAATSGTTTEMARRSAECPPEEMNAEDPLFILYTSGSTGKPKGVLHTTGGYLVYAAMTHQYRLRLS